MGSSTPEERAKLVNLLSIASVIRDLKQTPSGPLYAHMMTLRSITLEEYNAHIGLLKKLGAVSESNYLIKWEGKAAAINQAIDLVYAADALDRTPSDKEIASNADADHD